MPHVQPVTVLAALALATASPALAAGHDAIQPAYASPSDTTPSVAKPTDTLITKAGAALAQIIQIEADYSDRMDAAQTPGDLRKLAESMTGDAVKAIQDQGLSPDQYKQVMQTAQTDPDVRSRLLAAAQDALSSYRT